MNNSFSCDDTLSHNGKKYQIINLTKLENNKIKKLPFSLKILLENLLRFEDGETVTTEDIEALINWEADAKPNTEISFRPSRVILQDFTGVPAIVDLAAMRDATIELGANPDLINPLAPVELVIDHSVMVDKYGSADAAEFNSNYEFKRNFERYKFLHWGQSAFDNFKVVPPNTGIVHQVNLEYLAKVVFTKEINNKETINTKEEKTEQAYLDTLVGTDSHTTMINGLGVLAWGVGGIEAEAAMLGQPISMLIPQVVGFKLTGSMPQGASATDLVLIIVEMLRKKGVVGKFVEFFGNGLKQLPLADRATIANMAPEYGATCGLFPIDQETLNFLKLSGRDKSQVSLVEAYTKKLGIFYDENTEDAKYSDVIELDLSSVKPSIAGPSRPQDRIELTDSKKAFNESLDKLEINLTNENADSLNHGSVVIAAITSCTNTSNPNVMLAAGLLAKAAVEKGLKTKPWVKTSLAPGSQVVTKYLEKAGLMPYLEKLGFSLVGYGCTTCIGNSGPLLDEVSKEINDKKLAVSAVLSGNRNFEGRVHPEVKLAYLASPPLVVAYALAGTMNIDLYNEPLGIDNDGGEVFLKDIWPQSSSITQSVAEHVKADMFIKSYDSVFKGDERWRSITTESSSQYSWSKDSTYVKKPPYFEGISMQIPKQASIKGARVLALLGDSVTTDHISPAGAIKIDSPAGGYLREHGVSPEDFNSYGSRRGNHEIMMRGTFANIRLRNLAAPGTEGGFTVHQPSNKEMTIFEAAQKYSQENVPSIVIAGSEYGTGSSRDWAAKGPRLLGVKAVIAKSFERIHRSNLIGMGILPLQFIDGEDANTLNLDASESFDFELSNIKQGCTIEVSANKSDGSCIKFSTLLRIDTPKELEYYNNGGILHYVLRKIAKNN